MNEQQQMDPMAVPAMRAALERMGSQVGGLTQQSAFWEMKYQEAKQSLNSVLELLEKNDIDLEALVASETTEDATEAPETAFPVSAPVEDGDDGSAPS